MLFTLALLRSASAWDPNAGVIPSYTDGGTPFGTGNPAALASIIDGRLDTHWQSDACYPSGWLSRPDLDVALGVCAVAGACSGAEGAVALATDGNLRSGSVTIPAGTTFVVVLPGDPAAPLARVRLHGVWTSALEVVAEGGGSGVSASRTVAPSADSAVAVNVDMTLPDGDGDGESDTVARVALVSSAQVTLAEVGVLSAVCFVQAGVDLGASTEVGWVRTRHWAGGSATASTLLASQDGERWTAVASLDPESLATRDTLVDPPVTARYLAVRHDLIDGDWRKAFLWELDAYDDDGPYGPSPAPAPNPTSFGELLGVNGLWGWGANTWSDDVPVGEGPDRFAFLSHARNYHNLGWDVRDPDTVPDYERMAAGGGTDAQPWLDWDREYGAWRARGIEAIDASIQFTAAGGFPVSAFSDPYEAGYGYAEAFARHFGPTRGTGAVTAIEAGNEPWDYPAAFYARWLEGFVDGARAGDPAVRVLAGALQAHTPEPADATEGHFMGARVSEAAAAGLGAVNVHAYSFAYDTDGTRLGVPPEDPRSSFRELGAALRWRDANTPGVPVWLTEWGWDSDGAGEACTATECVSEREQARYLVRGAMIGARWGLSRMDWYFFANVAGADGLFGRSGLVGSRDAGFASKRSHLAMQALVHTLGDRRFLRVVREDDSVWAYVLGDASGVPTHLVAWLPRADDGTRVEVALPVEGTPTAAWTLDGDSPVGEPVAPPSGWTLSLSPAPLVVAFVPQGAVDADADTGQDDAPDPDGCGCGGRRPSGVSPWGVSILVIAWRMRRDRSPVRRARATLRGHPETA